MKRLVHHFTRTELAFEEILIILAFCTILALSVFAYEIGSKVTIDVKARVIGASDFVELEKNCLSSNPRPECILATEQELVTDPLYQRCAETDQECIDQQKAEEKKKF